MLCGVRRVHDTVRHMRRCRIPHRVLRRLGRNRGGNAMKWRVWYGNGQVSESVSLLSQAETLLMDAQRDCPGARLSRYECDGDWSIRLPSGRWTLLL